MPSYNVQVIPHRGIPNGHIRDNLFPKLKTVIGRHFAYAFASHGWSTESIGIEGSAPPNLKQQIKMAVVSGISGSGIAVVTDYD